MTAQRSHDRVLVLAGCLALVVQVSFGTTQLAVSWGLGLVSGFLLGWILTRYGWSFGRKVALAAGVASVLAAAIMADQWDAWNLTTTLNIDQMAAQELPESMQVSLLKVKEYWLYLGAGLCFHAQLLGACVAVAVASRLARVCHALPAPADGFLTMRPPEWLVWVAIGVAGLWFADQKWPGTALRPISWSAAIGLASVYWLNGWAIIGYALRAFSAHAVLYVVVFVLFVQTPVPIFAGLFDTWGEFRVKVDRLVEARRKSREDSGDDEF